MWEFIEKSNNGLFGLLCSWSSTYFLVISLSQRATFGQKRPCFLPYPLQKQSRLALTSLPLHPHVSPRCDLSTYPVDSKPSILCFHKYCVILVRSPLHFLVIFNIFCPWFCFWDTCVEDCVMLFNSFNKVESFSMPLPSGIRGFCCSARVLMLESTLG